MTEKLIKGGISVTFRPFDVPEFACVQDGQKVHIRQLTPDTLDALVQRWVGEVYSCALRAQPRTTADALRELQREYGLAQ